LQPFCENNATTFPELDLTEEEWSQIDQLIKELMPSKICTKVLQSEQLATSMPHG
jgi:hypothetical protein